jgi:hypothetical protein
VISYRRPHPAEWGRGGCGNPPLAVRHGSRVLVARHQHGMMTMSDPERQIMLIRDRESGMVMPWCRHSTGKTTTDSNTDGHGGRETDEDYTED